MFSTLVLKLGLKSVLKIKLLFYTYGDSGSIDFENTISNRVGNTVVCSYAVFSDQLRPISAKPLM